MLPVWGGLGNSNRSFRVILTDLPRGHYCRTSNLLTCDPRYQNISQTDVSNEVNIGKAIMFTPRFNEFGRPYTRISFRAYDALYPEGLDGYVDIDVRAVLDPIQATNTSMRIVEDTPTLVHVPAKSIDPGTLYYFVHRYPSRGLIFYTNESGLPTHLIPSSPATSATLYQWGSKALNWSSQYDVDNWGAIQILGPPSTSSYGDQICAWDPFENDLPPPPGLDYSEWIEIGYDIPVHVTGVEIYENIGAGSVIRILAKKPDGTWDAIWSGDFISDMAPAYHISTPEVCATPYKTDQLRLEINTMATIGVEGFDALMLIGTADLGDGLLYSEEQDLQVVYVPDANAHGENFDSFEVQSIQCSYLRGYRQATPSISTVFISVVPTNDAPVAYPSGIFVAEGESVAVNVSFVDIDTDGSDMYWDLMTLPSGGLISLNSTVPVSATSLPLRISLATANPVTYTPYSGSGCMVQDSLQFRMFDGNLTSANATLTIIVACSCNPGTRRGPNGLCEECEVGYYSEYPNMPVCIPCSSGTFGPQTAMRSCLPCPTGHYTNASASTTCRPCEPGSFQDREHSASCITCSLSSYASQSAASQCDECPQHSFVSRRGATDIGECVCEEGYYSLGPLNQHNYTRCFPCAEGAECHGPTVIALNGYWTPPWNSTHPLRCDEEGVCLGSKGCQSGYTGTMCRVCDHGYGMTTGGCIPCTSQETSQTMVFLAFLIMTLLAGLVVRFQLKSVNPNSDNAAILFKIFMSYVQVTAVASEIALNWPQVVWKALEIQGTATSPIQNIVNFECLGVSIEGTSKFFLYELTMASLPVWGLIGPVLVVSCWRTIHMLLVKRAYNFLKAHSKTFRAYTATQRRGAVTSREVASQLRKGSCELKDISRTTSPRKAAHQTQSRASIPESESCISCESSPRSDEGHCEPRSPSHSVKFRQIRTKAPDSKDSIQSSCEPRSPSHSVKFKSSAPLLGHPDPKDSSEPSREPRSPSHSVKFRHSKTSSLSENEYKDGGHPSSREHRLASHSVKLKSNIPCFLSNGESEESSRPFHKPQSPSHSLKAESNIPFLTDFVTNGTTTSPNSPSHSLRLKSNIKFLNGYETNRSPSHSLKLKSNIKFLNDDSGSSDSYRSTSHEPLSPSHLKKASDSSSGPRIPECNNVMTSDQTPPPPSHLGLVEYTPLTTCPDEFPNISQGQMCNSKPPPHPHPSPHNPSSSSSSLKSTMFAPPLPLNQVTSTSHSFIPKEPESYCPPPELHLSQKDTPLSAPTLHSPRNDDDYSLSHSPPNADLNPFPPTAPLNPLQPHYGIRSSDLLGPRVGIPSLNLLNPPLKEAGVPLLGTAITWSDVYVLSFVVCVFLVHPHVAHAAFEMFRCKNLSDGHSFLRADMSIECGSEQLFKLQTLLGIPMLLFTFTVPLFCVFILWKKSHEVREDFHFRMRYGFIYRGYSRKYYYWEVVVMCRKLLVVGFSVFYSGSVRIEALLLFGLIVVSVGLNAKCMPYDSRLLAYMDLLSVTVFSFTIYIGNFYLAGVDAESNKAMTALLMAFNCTFLAIIAILILKDLISYVKPVVAIVKMIGNCIIELLQTLFLSTVKTVHPTGSEDEDEDENDEEKETDSPPLIHCPVIASPIQIHTQPNSNTIPPLPACDRSSIMCEASSEYKSPLNINLLPSVSSSPLTPAGINLNTNTIIAPPNTRMRIRRSSSFSGFENVALEQNRQTPTPLEFKALGSLARKDFGSLGES
mmetsp:Transcript_36460/g.58979  ORF Transcript_36460/g.58979 Transcript_36460/m.58979 type:complete len:1731 (+) Transcript_36460:513-5705(+)